MNCKEMLPWGSEDDTMHADKHGTRLEDLLASTGNVPMRSMLLHYFAPHSQFVESNLPPGAISNVRREETATCHCLSPQSNFRTLDKWQLLELRL